MMSEAGTFDILLPMPEPAVRAVLLRMREYSGCPRAFSTLDIHLVRVRNCLLLAAPQQPRPCVRTKARTDTADDALEECSRAMFSSCNRAAKGL